MAYESAGKEISRVLIVDDVEENRFVLRDIITDMGYLPILTENGIQALKMVERYHPQLIILDVAMPEMDGYEFCKIVKEKADTRDIPIIFISAFDDPADIVRGFGLGGEDYITKPFIPEVVKARVRLHLKLAETNRSMMEINRQLQVSVNEQLRQMEIEKKNVLYALTRVAQENVFYDSAYMERVKYNCRILTEAMQLSATFGKLISDNYIETVAMAVPLRDIGNVAVPLSRHGKSEELTEEELDMMRKHTTAGAQILHDIRDNGDYNEYIQIALDIARCHHENWDGSGYPEGKKGDEIPLAAQIVAIVSEYCDITQKDEDHEGCSSEEAFARMEEDAGVKFNPDIFQIFRKIARQLH